MMGISSYYQEKDRKRQEFYFRNRTIWGGPAFGGKKDPQKFLMPGSKSYMEDQDKMFRDPAEVQGMEGQQLTPDQYNNLLGVRGPQAPRGPAPPQADIIQRQAQQQQPLGPAQQAPQQAPSRMSMFTPENLGMEQYYG
jgi:hypothetical protein